MDQIKNNKGVTEKIINKKVIVYKKDSDIVIGYVKAIKSDSIFISPKKKRDLLIAIPGKDVQKIKIKNENNKKVLYIIPIAIAYYVINKLTDGLTSIAL